MRPGPLSAFIATLISMGLAFSFLHGLILWLNLPDLAALLMFALPVVAYIAYCTQNSRRQALLSAIRIYTSFAAVVLACAGLVYLIG